MGKTIHVLASAELPEREPVTGRMMVDLCENIHIHYRDLRMEFSLPEFWEFLDMLRRSGKDVRDYLASNPEYREGAYPTTVLIADGGRRPIRTSKPPHRSTYFPNRYQVELQEPTFAGEVHIHRRDYRLEITREELRAEAAALAEAVKELVRWEAANEYPQRPAKSAEDMAEDARQWPDRKREHKGRDGHFARLIAKGEVA